MRAAPHKCVEAERLHEASVCGGEGSMVCQRPRGDREAPLRTPACPLLGSVTHAQVSEPKLGEEDS